MVFEKHGYCSKQNGYVTELTDILKTIKEQQIISVIVLEQHFWRMFVADAFLGNFDRHNGNWGFLVNNEKGDVKIVPIYDCGSCLYPQLEEDKMSYVMNKSSEIEERIFMFPTSAIKYNDKKINYYQFLMETKETECLNALKYIGERIDLNKINSIILDTPYISDIHKNFLKVFVKERKEQIIDAALKQHNI